MTQNQALNALIFLYKEVLKVELEGIDARRAKHSRRLPVVLTVAEMGELLKGVTGDAGLVCRLLYGCGLRLAEALALRVKDVDMGGGKVEVRGGKGDKDRVIPLPKSLRPALVEHLARVEMVHRADRQAGAPGVALPHAMEVKQPKAGESLPWFWVFPAPGLSEDPRSGITRRHHLHEVNVSRELARAAGLAGIGKRVTPHVLRHSYATHVHRAGAAARDIQEVLGHGKLETTMNYLATDGARVRSPLDVAREPGGEAGASGVA